MLNRTQLKTILTDIDNEVFLTFGKPTHPYSVLIVGGSAFMLNDLTRRPATHDIDVLEADANVRAVLAQYKLVNFSVNAFINCIPYNYEDRLVKLSIHGSAVEFFTPSLEDLVVMKLYRESERDKQDITSPEVLSRINWDLLGQLVNDPDEARASALSEKSYQEMRSAYLRYEKEYRHETDL